MPDLGHIWKFPFRPQDANNMSTEELERLLREDFESDNQDPDPKKEAFLLHAAEVIDERKKNDPDAPRFNTDAEWRKFQDSLCIAHIDPIYRCTNEELDELSDMLEQYLEQYEEKEQANLKFPQPEFKRAGHRIPWKKVFAFVAAAVVMGACFLGANGDSLFKVKGNSTPDTFQFQPETGTSQNITQTGTYLDDNQTLHDLLTEQGITELVSPKWIPEGYSLSDLRPNLELDEPVFTALYESDSGTNSIIQWVIVHRTVQPALAENDDINVPVYTVEGIRHHIIRNDDTLTATWFNENIECSLIGKISEEEMEAMINSIYHKE